MSDLVYSQQLATTTGTLPIFRGLASEDVRHWVRMFELTRHSRCLDEDLSRLLLLCSIDGEAKNFYNFSRSDEFPINIVLEKLIKRFDINNNIPQAQELMDSLTKDPCESWVGFVERFTVLARRCSLPENFQVAWILKKLPQNLQLMLGTLRLASVDVTVDGIISALSACHNRGLDILTCTSGIPDEVCKISKKKKKKWCNLHKRCYHSTSECKGIKHNSNYNFSVSCNNVFREKRFITKIKINTVHSALGLIDTGADVSCIKNSLAKRLGLKLQGTETLNSFNGSAIECKWTEEIKIELYNKSLKIKMIAVENLTHPIIIGNDIIRMLLEEVSAEIIFGTGSKLNINQLNHRSMKESVIVDEFEQVMCENVDSNVKCNAPEFQIKTTSENPIVISRRRLGKIEDDIVEEEVRKLLKNGIIRHSNSPWASPIVLADKKDGTRRLCVDYRKLNDITVRDAYPLPRIDDILDSLGNAKIFSTLDATSGYHQIPLAEEDIPKTAFQTRSGLYEYVRMPFGLTNAPAAFQRTMDSIFKEERNKFLQVYLDDIIIFSPTREE